MAVSSSLGMYLKAFNLGMIITLRGNVVLLILHLYLYFIVISLLMSSKD